MFNGISVPGVVIAHSPASSGIYVGSPGIAALPDGAYLAKWDEFGPQSTEHTSAITHVHRSQDRGLTWEHVARIDGAFWSSLFVHRDAVYLLGTECHHGRIVIRRSDDGGRTWTEPADTSSGLLTPEGQYHTAPMPILIHDGRIWRAMEDAMGGQEWGERYRAMMMTAPIEDDLLRQDSWTFSNTLAREPQWLGGEWPFRGWLEGNAVLSPNGEVVNILRVDHQLGGKAAVVHVSADGKSVSFDPAKDFIDFPGGAKKFTIRFDENSKLYWSLTNLVPPRYADAQRRASTIRNTLALVCSSDLIEWTIRCIVLHDPDEGQHSSYGRSAFQYVDWLFEGDDLILLSRTAYDDGLGGAHRGHDANFLTFHRIEHFRQLTLADSVVDVSTLGLSQPTSPAP
ncbi:MAG: exo-alpha-sialidase [Phycisphaeraceae bacterium]|nr:exo-alpha-sialidase [Phycisphaeraceae bacterium]